MPSKEPKPLPLSATEFAIVGSLAVFQQMPRFVTAEPPSLVTLPPPLAEPGMLLLMPRVTTVGATIARRPCAPLVWKSLKVALELFVPRTQYQ